MTSLVACLSTGKGTWGHVSRLISDQNWDSIFLIAKRFAAENFNNEKAANIIIIDENKPLPELIGDISSALERKITGTEVALNMVSGSGKEHMALLSSLLKMGFAVRLVALTKDGIKEV